MARDLKWTLRHPILPKKQLKAHSVLPSSVSVCAFTPWFIRIDPSHMHTLQHGSTFIIKPTVLHLIRTQTQRSGPDPLTSQLQLGISWLDQPFCPMGNSWQVHHECRGQGARQSVEWRFQPGMTLAYGLFPACGNWLSSTEMTSTWEYEGACL